MVIYTYAVSSGWKPTTISVILPIYFYTVNSPFFSMYGECSMLDA
jgi:hypothetical protein